MAEGTIAEQGSEKTRIVAIEAILREYRVRVDETQPTQVEIEQATKIRVVSNLEVVELQKLTKPEWAVEYGRDVYGVYGDFEIESTKDGSIVQQRLRWIPPGSFKWARRLMSPVVLRMNITSGHNQQRILDV